MNQNRLKFAAAVAFAVGTMGVSSAWAQSRVGSDGRLRDASNLVGSSGYNQSGGNGLASNAIGNAIVNGDITGGKFFHGATGHTDADAFRGNLPGSGIADFVGNSTGISTSGVVTNNSNQTRIYLGENRGVSPPSNFVQLGNAPGYIASPPLGASVGDERLGNISSTLTSGTTTQSLYAPAGTEAGESVRFYVGPVWSASAR